MPAHPPLSIFAVRQAIERAASVYLGRSWRSKDFVDLDDSASHRSGIFLTAFRALRTTIPKKRQREPKAWFRYVTHAELAKALKLSPNECFS